MIILGPNLGIITAVVMLARGWKWFVAAFVVSAAFSRMHEVWINLVHSDLAMEPFKAPLDSDFADSELTDAPVLKAPVEQAPPPAPSMPIGNRFFSVGLQPLGGILPAFRAR